MAKKFCVGLVVILSVFTLAASSAQAGSRYGAFFKACDSFKSSESFVRGATLYCLKTGNASLCDREARKFYQACGFGTQEEYVQLSHEVYRKMLKAVFVMNASQRLMK
jgi:hypothetical protein